MSRATGVTILMLRPAYSDHPEFHLIFKSALPTPKKKKKKRKKTQKTEKKTTNKKKPQTQTKPGHIRK